MRRSGYATQNAKLAGDAKFLTPLESIRLKAQASADRDRRPVVIYNLNPFSALYVMREYSPGCETSRDFVELVRPGA